ncbi:msx2-interacting protein isoform X2 [Siphateles boraxobius]|uniref:msx2-interacting protein isoform X2 n=1 Tax=Siphateles boraxobius TaxID=180520 RepID=UPI00406382AD
MVRETRHLWVGNLPENVREEKIIEHFKRYGRVESVKVLPKRGSEGGVAAFVDFVDIKSAQKAHNSVNKMGDRDLRTDYNEPGTIPSAARGLDDSLSIATRGRDVSGFTRGAGGPVYVPPVSLHSREGRFERRLDGAADSRERSYDHSSYGHHERSSSSNTSSFDRQRHYETDYYRDSRDRALSGASGSASSASGSIGGGSSAASVGVAGSVAGSSSAAGSSGSTAGVGSGGSTPGGIVYYGSRSRSPSRFETTETRYEPRAREAFTLASVVHRDLYREERGRRGDRTYHHSRSRSPQSSHNPSPQRLVSQAARPARSRSGSGSNSRSSSSDSVSSTSSSGSGSDSSSSSSDRSPARSVQSAAVPAPSAQPLPSLDKDEPRKSFGIKVQNLPVRSTDTSLKDGLFHEFKKHGKVTSVQIHGASEERYGLVFFRQQEDQEKALSASKGKLFFGMQIDVTAWHGPETESENEFRPLDERIDEFHPKATRTLFIGNLEKTTTYHDLLNIFQRFGEIVDIDIKKVNGSPQYAFLQYCDIASVCKAIKKMDGEYLGNNRLKLGFGKSMPTTCVWLDGLSSSITEQYLTRHFCRYGHVVKVVFDRLKGMALILYNNIEYAQAAVKETKGWKIGGNKIKVDFANQESQMAFYRSMQASGQDIRDFYEIISERRDERRPPYHEFTAERAYYENVRTPGSYTEDPRRKYPARSREFYSEWDPYQGDYYDPRYYDDPREYRDYRDPYEQDIRKYSYLQRERERERERFETDHERDHGRRTIEHNQSPSHPRRPASPAASPSLSERPPSDSEHHVYSRSSDRSGSCSSLSPPQFEKSDKIRLERHNRSDKSEKDKSVFEVDRGNGGEKERRAGRKEKGDKDRPEKQKLRKSKLASPTVPSSETDLELDRDTSPEASLTLRGKASKSFVKDYSGKGKLDLPPCVVQLTRVKEKEGKLIDSILSEQKTKVGSDPVRSPTTPPSVDHKSMPFRIDTQGRDFFKHGKHLKEKGLASQVEVVDKEGKVKNKKYFKTDLQFDTSSSVDADRLAARKRRFEETSGKADNLRRISPQEDEGKLRRFIDEPLLKDINYDKKLLRKEAHKREQKMKSERMVTVSTLNDELDTVMSVGLSLDLQARLGEPIEEAIDSLDSLDQKIGSFGANSQPSFSLAVSDDGSVDMEFSRDQEPQHLTSYNMLSSRLERDSESKESLVSDIDHSQSCRKQMEQNRRLQQQMLECDKSDKTESTPSTDAEDFEHRSLVHELGKPPQDVTGDSPPTKRKKFGAFEIDFVTKRERDYQRFRRINDEPERRLASLPGTPFSEEERNASQLLDKEPDSPVAMDKNYLHLDVLKYNLGNTVHQGLLPHAEILKVKASVTEEEFFWESNIRQTTLRGEMSFPTSFVKRESIRKRPECELEPGEVQSDSDEDGESRHLSLKLNSFKREHEEKLSDVKSSESLEKNKFYEFALDKTITPDTKALLERAKSLSSSREENWSFLGHDSKFKNFQNSTDKEKSEPTPRPIPSWYMKKKKIRSDSDGKLDVKKEDAKPDEQERQELFASRFLHSSIFEQDSRRLQHLERKSSDPEVRVWKESITNDSKGEQAGAGGTDLSQEPRVLFHSRFLELQQRDKNQQLPISERVSVNDQMEEEKTLDEEFGPSPNVSEISQELSVSHIPATTSPMTLSKASETSVQHDKLVLPSTLLNLDSQAVVNERPEDAPKDYSPLINLKEENTAVALSTTPPEPMIKEDVTVKEPNEKMGESKRTVSPIVEQDIDVKPPTPGASLINVEPECDPFQASSPFQKPSQAQEIADLSEIKMDPANTYLHKVASPLDVELPDTEPEIELVQTPRKQPKSKKLKTVSPASTPNPQVANEKPATRKSERIDREKLKRSSSPRGDSTKLIADSRNSAKSPVHATDSEQGHESNTNHGRTRQRRNVRSVYATPLEDEAPQSGKEITEPPRVTRKRCSDKEAGTQHMVTTLGRRGRPPKTRRRGDEISPVKGDHTKNSESEDSENKESACSGEISKATEAWRSPRSQKGQSSPIRAGQSRKTLKLDKVQGSPESIKSDIAGVDVSPALDHQAESKDETSMHVGQLSQDTKQQNISKRENEFAHSVKGKTTDADIEITPVEKTPTLDKKIRTSRPTRNTKTMPEDTPVNVINLTVDAAKNVLHSGEDKAVSLEGSLKTKAPHLVKEGSTIPVYHKEEDVHSTDEKDESLSEIEPPTDPVAALLARQMELERAVENISKLTDEQLPAPYKEPCTEPPTLTPPVIVQPADDTEVEKPANPASETELAAAIDSITAEDISGDADGFSAPTTYTALLPTPETLVLPVSGEVIEPEKNSTVKTIVQSEQDSVKVPDSKSYRTCKTDTSFKESPLSEAAKKGGRARPKTPKKSRGRKVTLNRKLDMAEDAVQEPESTTVKLPESIPEEIKTANPKAATSAAAAAVVTVAAACKHEATSIVILDTPKEAEQPAVDQPEPQESAFHSGNNSPSYSRTQQLSPEPVSSTITSPTACLNSPTSSKTPLSPPEWKTRTEEKGTIPKPQVNVSLSTAGVGGPPANPPIPPDTKASDIDPSSSTLRKILMEPKYVSASNSNAVPGMQFTTTDPRMSNNENSVEAVLPLKTSLPEDRPSPITQLVPCTAPPQPPLLQQCGTPQILKEKLAITSTATSVISRIPMPFDFEDTPRISLSNRSSGMSIPKQKYCTGLNENSKYHALNPSEDGVSVGRPVVESTHCNTGSSTGLRVNTSEGVVVLSYSGQKTGGPQRIIAKISQIPPASAVDIEFQQSVTKSQIKQEPTSHPSTPKGSQTPTGYGHAGVVLAGQTFSAQPVISSINQECPSSEKSEPSYHTGQHGGSVKTFQQSTSHPQLLRYSQSITQQQHFKKNGVTETISMKTDIKPSQNFNVKPVLSPHHPSLVGNHILSSSVQHERVVSQPKQDSHSPRSTGHSTSPFPKVCPPSSSVVLGPAGPISQYVSNIHHAEQSVIMPPHSVTQSMPIGHLSQGDVRASTASLSGIGYGIRSENLLSPRSAPPQRSTTPQPAVIRDVVLKSHAGLSVGGQVETSNDDMLNLPQGLRRASAPQLQPESIVMQPEFKGLHHRALRLDQYARDVRLLVHQHLSDHPGVVENRQTRTPEAMQSPSHISSTSSKASPVVKSAPQIVRDAPKAMELKMTPSPHSDSRIIGHTPGSVMVSSQGVQLIHTGNPNSMSEYYREMRGFHSQYPSHSVIGINMANRGIAASQVSQVDQCQRQKVPSVSSVESVGSFGESKLDGSHIRHPSSMDLSHISRVQSETGSPSYTSPVNITPKLDLPITAQKGPQGPISNQLPRPSSASSQMRSEFKLDHTGLRSVDMVQLLTKYPIIWQGHLALKNDTAAVQLHFVSGNNVLAHRSLPPPEGGAFLRIAQRMRLEVSQLEGVARRMTAENEYCLLLALPCGLDQEDVHNQTHALKTGFITYLQAKQAAGIINVPNPGSNQPAYVVQIFPPCEFSESHLSHLAPDLLNSISSISPHLMIVIASV